MRAASGTQDNVCKALDIGRRQHQAGSYNASECRHAGRFPQVLLPPALIADGWWAEIAGILDEKQGLSSAVVASLTSVERHEFGQSRQW
jgi:hypothetical protein